MTPRTIAICTGARIDRATEFQPYIVKAMDLYEINTPLRQAMFLANVGHESGGLHWLTELWGPTPTQSRYEGRKDLGNVQAGDGYKFKGHGPIQTTGRSNHARVRDRLRKRFPEMLVPDFEVKPELLAEPEWGCLAAADFWDDNNINQFADINDFDGACDAVNRGHKTRAIGDSNGFADRLKLFNAALPVLT